MDELPARLARQPAEFRLKPRWPNRAIRPMTRRRRGRPSAAGRARDDHADEGRGGQRGGVAGKLLFLPTNLADGIEPSDDPLIDARGGLRGVVRATVGVSTDEHRTVKAARTPAEYPDLLKEFGPNKDQHVVNRVGCHIELWNASHAAWALSIATLRAVLASAVAAPSTARPATPRGQFIATLIAEQAGSGLSNSGIIVFMA